MTKTSIHIVIDEKLKKTLNNRAKKEMLSIEELIVDILRRSTLTYMGKKYYGDKVDDKFLTFFSRKGKKKA
ncbi:MAG: hypothetical protein AABW65_03585 [Nanoarchaeota archaeon]